MSEASSPAARVERALGRVLAAVPDRATRLLAGAPVEIDGQTLDPEAQALLRCERLLGLERPPPSVEAERSRNARAARLARGRPFPVAAVEAIEVPGAQGPLESRLYVPPDVPGSGPLLVWFHGGGYVIGDLDTHDQLCRLLCSEIPTRVLSVAYRRAPEHPFPAALEDARAAFSHAAGAAAELGGAPGDVAVGGDSAGGGLAVAVSLLAREEGTTPPARQVLVYPWCDLSRKRRSHELFREGFFLNEERLDRWAAMYLQSQDPADPRVSPLCADDLSGLPATDILLAGFDPLRDEGLELARRLRESGTDVELTLAPDLVHGFVNAAGISGRFRQALAEFTRSVVAG